MSSMRNAVQRRPHRERAQPLERRRLGLLEKHKDYSLRAKDFNKKKAQLKALREKASERNEDEFYFGMLSRKGPGSRIMDGRRWTGTVEGDRGNKAMDVDTVRLLKTQDLGYARTMKQVVAKEVAKLEEQVVLTRGFDNLDEEDQQKDDDDDSEFDFSAPLKPKAPRKIVFFDDEEQREELRQDQVDQDEDEQPEGSPAKEGDDEREKSLRRLQRQLEAARKKHKVLSDVESALEIQRAKMAKTATSGGQTRKGKKIMVRTRKR
ncbi:small-subunit processome [Dactylonectria estremocensis]|uniref:U3 small nucleolar RNA-associated protein 11 n=1 Tax=Dactylonectria estremocensis TaxID=1079267 RepID=A0A9P9JDB5_9HYPO|nr:small-subunit processome [Dactylonectria estremocensis]